MKPETFKPAVIAIALALALTAPVLAAPKHHKGHADPKARSKAHSGTDQDTSDRLDHLADQYAAITQRIHNSIRRSNDLYDMETKESALVSQALRDGDTGAAHEGNVYGMTLLVDYLAAQYAAIAACKDAVTVYHQFLSTPGWTSRYRLTDNVLSAADTWMSKQAPGCQNLQVIKRR